MAQIRVSLTYLCKFNFVFATFSGQSGKVIIGFECDFREPIAVKITDAVGRQILNSVIYPIEGFNKNSIQLPDISGGIYLISLLNSTEVLTKKFFMN